MALGSVAAAGFSFAGGLYGETFIILTPTPQPGRPSGTLRRQLAGGAEPARILRFLLVAPDASAVRAGPARCYGTRSPLKNIRARDRIIFLFLPRAGRAENKGNQQCHFKSSRWRMEQLDTDSCRGTVPMEPPMPNCSMRHQNPVGDFDDTGQIL